MATLENGFAKLANELLTMIYSTNFTATEFKILLLIIRFTYGYSKKSTDLSLTYISRGIGVSKRYVSSSLSKLIEDKVVIVVREHTDTQSRVIGINKHCEQWENRSTVQQMKQSSTGEVKQDTTGEAEFNTTDEAEFHQEKKTLKKTINKGDSDFSKTEKPKPKPKSNDNLYNENFEKLWKLYPNKKGKAQVSNTKKKEIYKLGDEFERCISRYKEDVEAQRKNGFKELNYKNGSTFFRSGYVDYLDENYKVEEEKKPTRQLKMVYRDLLGGEGIEPDTGH